jgi:hypothetical protein
VRQLIVPKLETLREMWSLAVDLREAASSIEAPAKTMEALSELMDDIAEMIKEIESEEEHS